MKVMVIEDNPQMADVIRKTLEEASFEVDVAHEGFTGETMAATRGYDMIVLDLMLPDRDGMDICSTLRRHGVNTPLLMLTSLSNTEQKVRGLQAGADDYLTKPFEPSELLARVQAIVRRTQGEDNARLRFDELVMDLLTRRVTRDGQRIELTAKEFSLLECFLRNPHRVMSKVQLGSRVWDSTYEDDSNVIEVYMSRLRRKMDKPFEKPLLHTVVGCGYMLSDEPPAC